MRRTATTLLAGLFCIVLPLMSQAQGTITTTWGGLAEKVYDTGFMHKLMKPPGGGVSLFDIELIENDAPGSGRNSEKGVCAYSIWGKNHARKILRLGDARAVKAWLVTQFYHPGKYPLRFTLNGYQAQVDTTEVSFPYHYTEFPAKWLVRGNNIIDMSCPEATKPEEGWEIYLARADEFEAGGGDPAHVGETSFASGDGGKSWKESPFGPQGRDRAEYTVRLSLDRYVRTGWLASPVIDLWKGDSTAVVTPLREVRKMRLTISSDVPEGASVEYYFRKGTDPQPFSEDWEEYKLIGGGPSLDFTLSDADLNRRYVQFKAVLSTTNPLKSPVVKTAQVKTEMYQRVPDHKNIYLLETDNPVIEYSSLQWEWEPWDRPEFQELRERVNMDEVIAGSRTTLDKVMKIAAFTSKYWRNMNPWPGYPQWDGLSILNKIEYSGGGGYCLMLNSLVMGMCLACGIQAHLTHIDGHEICEVWCDELGKWVFVDGDYVNHYNYLLETGEPQNMLELHSLYLDYYFPGRSVDWMKDKIMWQPLRNDLASPVGRASRTHPKDTQLTGFICAAYLFMAPRNNFYEKPYPRCLNQCHISTWDGFIHWYDMRTPPRRQYSWYTDRPRDMYPDINLVHIDAVSGFGSDRLFLRFETYTPNFSHFEVSVDETGWQKASDRYTWLLQSGRNTFKVRAVNKLGVRGKQSVIVLNHAEQPFAE